MNTSLFIELIQKFWTAITGVLKINYNDERNAPTYLYMRQLREVFSPTLKWNRLTLDRSIVAADVVALDSERPLKSRPALSTANGDIPKLAIKRYKDEKELVAIRSMLSDPNAETEVARQLIAEPADFCSRGIMERIEYMYLQAISTGLCVIPDAENVGTGIRVDFGHPDSQKYGANKPWGTDGATPISDITRIISDAADLGYVITRIMSDSATFNAARNSDEGKMITLGFLGTAIAGTGGALPNVSSANFRDAVKDEYGIEWEVVNRSIRVEKNGVKTAVRPFAANTVAFLTSDQTGTLQYGASIEDTFPTEGVTYSKVAPYITVMQYSKTDPKREWTAAEGFAMPVIEVDELFLLNTQEAQIEDPAEVEGDANITIYGEQLVKADVIAALNSLGIRTNSNISDAKLIEKVNGLSDEQESELKSILEVTD